MSKKCAKVIPITKHVTEKELIDKAVEYLYSHLNRCKVEANSNGENGYAIAVYPLNKREQANITVTIDLHNDSCDVCMYTSKQSIKVRIILAVVSLPFVFPVSIALAASALLHLWSHNKFEKDFMEYIKTCVSTI